MDPRREPHSLPLAAVEHAWARLLAVYGQRFLVQYDGVSLAVVKEDWRRRLAGLSPEQVDYALDNLPAGKAPPDVLEFRRLALTMPDERRAALPAPSRPRPVPPVVLRALQALREPTDEPPHVQMARGYIARWDAEAAKPKGLRPTPQQQQWIVHYRRVIETYERRQAAAAATAAAEAADRERAERIANESPTPGDRPA